MRKVPNSASRRGEFRASGLVALRWRDIAFTAERVRVCGSFAGPLTSPEERRGPVGPDGAGRGALARLAARGYWTGDDDLVFRGVTGSYLDASARSRRYKAAFGERRSARSASTTCATRSARG